MHPASLYQALVFLKQNIKDVDNVMENMPHDLLGFSDNEDGQKLDNSSDSIEEIENPLLTYSFESCLYHIHVTVEKVSIAPGEGEGEVSTFNDSLISYRKILL